MPSDRPKDRWNMDRGKLFMKSTYIELDALYESAGAQEPFQTLLIDGREYVLHLFPHS